VAILVSAAFAVPALFWGCSRAPKTCTITPVDVEEVLADTRDLDADLAKLQEELAGVQAELNDWESQVAERRARMPQLRDELVRLKKMSGVSEEPMEASGAQAATRP